MRRNSPLRFWLSISGIVAAVVLAPTGGLLLWGSAYVHNTVQSQLASQQITFPPAGAFAHPKPHRDHAEHDPVGQPVAHEASPRPDRMTPGIACLV